MRPSLRSEFRRTRIQSTAILPLALFAFASSARAGDTSLFDFDSSCTALPDFADKSKYLLAAASTGIDLADGAVAYFAGPATANHAPYEKWFGAWDYTDADWPPDMLRADVQKRTREIWSSLTSWRFRFFCVDWMSLCYRKDGSPNFDAYVDGSQTAEPFEIVICPAFYSKSMDPHDPNGAPTAIAHEVSHFKLRASNGDEGARTVDREPHAPGNVQVSAMTYPPENHDKSYAYQYFLGADPGGRFADGGVEGGRPVGGGAGDGGSAVDVTGGCHCELERRRGAHSNWLLFATGLLILVTRRFAVKKMSGRHMLMTTAAALLFASAALGLAACARDARATSPSPSAFKVDRRFDCQMSAPSSVHLGEPVPLTFTVRNRSRQTLRVLSERWPISETPGSYYRVTCDGKPADYIGVFGDRGLHTPRGPDYKSMRPGDQLSGTLDLNRLHRLSTGHCTIVYTWGISDVLDNPSLQPRPDDEQHYARLDCKPLAIEVLP